MTGRHFSEGTLVRFTVSVQFPPGSFHDRPVIVVPVSVPENSQYRLHDSQ